MMLDKVFFDTETTDLKPGQIGQLAYIKEKTTGEIEAGNYFFAVDNVSDGAAKVTGRDTEFYTQASCGIKFADKADEIYRVFDNSMLVAHNLPFDENFLSMEFWRVGKTLALTPDKRFDTMQYFTDVLKIPNYRGGKKKYKYPKLEELVSRLNINKEKVKLATSKVFSEYFKENYGFHDAMYDTMSMFIAFAVYRDMLNGTDYYKSAFTI